MEHTKLFCIPLGTRCSSAFVIRDNIGKRDFSLPFDWLDMPLTAITKFISVKYADIPSFTKKYFNELGVNHIHADGTQFPHDIQFVGNTWVLKSDTKDKFVRRLKRLSKILSSNGFFVFLTTIIETSKYKESDFAVLKKHIENVVGIANCLFITINLGSNKINGNHYNFEIIADSNDSGYKIWENAIADKFIYALNHFGIMLFKNEDRHFQMQQEILATIKSHKDEMYHYSGHTLENYWRDLINFTLEENVSNKLLNGSLSDPELAEVEKILTEDAECGALWNYVHIAKKIDYPQELEYTKKILLRDKESWDEGDQLEDILRASCYYSIGAYQVYSFQIDATRACRNIKQIPLFKS